MHILPFPSVHCFVAIPRFLSFPRPDVAPTSVTYRPCCILAADAAALAAAAWDCSYLLLLRRPDPSPTSTPARSRISLAALITARSSPSSSLSVPANQRQQRGSHHHPDCSSQSVKRPLQLLLRLHFTLPTRRAALLLGVSCLFRETSWARPSTPISTTFGLP